MVLAAERFFSCHSCDKIEVEKEMSLSAQNAPHLRVNKNLCDLCASARIFSCSQGGAAVDFPPASP